jgi:hypothetical protein
MPPNRRQLGGQSNKRGNRYEDFFAVARLIEYAPRVMEEGVMVRAREQADCPVDDLVLKEPERTHYHQLKLSPDTTWRANGEKLLNEFRDQIRECENAGEAHRLFLVVGDEHRAGLLREAMPTDLGEVTRVLYFPILTRPSQLANLREMLGESFDRLRGSRFPSRTEDQAIAGAFLLGFAEHEPDEEGYLVLSQVIGCFPSHVRLRRTVTITHPGWPDAEAVLGRIADLRWWTDRGYFEWAYGETDNGIVDALDGESFRRFVDRIVRDQPKTFADFERALP